LKGANLNENWRNTWYGESSGCYVLKRSQEFFQEYEAEQKTKQKMLFLGVPTPFFWQNRAMLWMAQLK